MPNPPISIADSGAPTAQALRAALGRFATGVTIVACVDAQGQPAGITCNSFASLSLDPALVLWSLRLVSAALPAFDSAGHFSVNVLTEGQVDLSRRFAQPGDDKFAQGHWRIGLGGAPVLSGCAAVFECALHSHQTVGDHRLYIGQVLRLSEHALAPLLFQGGHYRMLGEVL